jgi:mono/diheme cytochrome c family protein
MPTPHRALALAAALAAALAPGSTRAAEPDGAALYGASCAKCHGDDGRAQTPVGKATKAPSLVTDEVRGADPAAIASKVRAVDKHEATIAGLGDPDIEAIARHVKTLAPGAP